MTNCVCDSGPLTHLWQIQWWAAFETFDLLHIPQPVFHETQAYVPLAQLSQHVAVQVHAVSTDDIDALRSSVVVDLQAQDVDLAVLALAQQLQPDLVLTDDLLLRRALETHALIPMGTIGVLLRAYSDGILDAQQLDVAIDRLFTGSTLYLSPSFKTYVRRVIADATNPSDSKHGN